MHYIEEREKQKSTYNLPLGLNLLGELVAAKLLKQLGSQGGRETVGVQVVDLGVILVRVDVDGSSFGLGEDAVQAGGGPLSTSQGALGAECQSNGGLVHLPHGAGGGRDGGKGSQERGSRRAPTVYRESAG